MQRLIKGDYVSIIRNRKIADMFKEAGLIEKYGTGIRRILQGFAEYELPEPKFEEVNGGFRVTAYQRVESVAKDRGTPPGVNVAIKRLLKACRTPKSRSELQQALGLLNKKHFLAAYLRPCLEAGLIELTIADKSSSRLQNYRLTEKGKNALEIRVSRRK